MRVLVTTAPGTGHVLPLVPLARKFHETGDEVIWATGPDACQQLATESFAKLPVGLPMGQLFQQLVARTRGRPGDGVPPHRLPHWFVPRLFGEVCVQAMIDGLLECARTFKPDVVLYESRCYAGPAVARSVGALSVMQNVTTLIEPSVEELVSDAVTPLWRQLGLETPTYAGMFDGLTLSAFPVSLDDSSAYPGLKVQRLAPPPPSPVRPPWFEEWRKQHEGRSLVYATLGTAFTNTKVLCEILEGLAGDECAVLMTVGVNGDPEALGPLPPRTRVERFVPQEAILPLFDAVVSHGGSGTTLGALACGLPHVIVPQGADQFINAMRCERAGLGRAVFPAAASPDTIRAAFRDVVTTPSFRENARRVGAEMAAGLSTDQAISLIRGAVPAR